MTIAMDRRSLKDSPQALREGLAAGSFVLTLAGEIPVEALKVGDRIITRSGAKTLRALHCAVIPSARLVSISASALGIEQPQDDMLVTPEQGLLIRDWRAKALRGVTQAIIPAGELLDGSYIRAETVRCACLYSLEFEAPEVIYANGLEVTCAYASLDA